MLRFRRALTLAVVTVPLLLLVLFVTRGFWLSGIGRNLVRNEQPEQAQLIVVLAGDPRGNRILRACDLSRQGWAPRILVSGPMNFYGLNEADLAIRYAVSKGCPASSLEPWYYKALSTADEATLLTPELIRRGVQKVLIVTSDYHTARAGRTFEVEFKNRLQLRMVAAKDDYFSADAWWQTREGQKTLLLEYSKTFARAAGL
ncbi:MAG: YdcF family protein [Bryobacteraceae bacterium]|nr:YdcF family protein [Bryobacteraceae bacterium]